MKNLLGDAKEYAIFCHESTNHKYDKDKPYQVHLNMVVDFAEQWMSLLDDNIDIDILLVSCWTHDVIEDTRQTYNDVKKVCGEQVADIVYALTNEKGRNRAERGNKKYYDGIRNNIIASFVKICDRLANVKYSKNYGSRMLDLYRKENDSFKDKLYRDDFRLMFHELEMLLK